MTENVFGGLALAEPQTEMLPVDEFDGGSDNRRKLALVGAVAGVVVLLLAAFFLLKGGGDEAAVPPPATVVPPATDQSGSDAGKAVADKPVKLPQSYKEPVGRDPFKALYTAPVETSGGGGGASASSDSPNGTTTAPSGTSVTPTTGDGTTTGTGEAPVAGFAPVWVELVSVKGTKTASFVVGYSNGKKSTTTAYAQVAAPTDDLRTTFGGVFALLSIQDRTATVQFGDGTPFDLSPGFSNRHFVG